MKLKKWFAFGIAAAMAVSMSTVVMADLPDGYEVLNG